MAKIGMVFPGYGSQFVGMGKEFYDEFRVVQEHFEEASSCLDINFVKLCFASSDADLSRIENAYVAIFLVSAAIHSVLKEAGIVPMRAAGFSLGEYAAALSANVITVPDALYLLAKYATFADQALRGMQLELLSIEGLDVDRVQACCEVVEGEDQPVIAIYRAPTSFVVSGSCDALARVQACALQAGAEKTSFKGIEEGLHSPIMAGALNNFAIYLEKIDFRDPLFPLVSSSFATDMKKGLEVKKSLVKQIDSSIYWDTTVHRFANVDIIVHVGPGSDLMKNFQRMFPEKPIVAVNRPDDVVKLVNIVAQFNSQE